MESRLPARKNRRLCRLHSDNFHRRILLTQVAPRASDRPASANTSNENVDLPSCVIPHFWTSGCVVAVCVGWVLELRKHVGIWSFCHNLLCLLDSLAHSHLPSGEHQLSPKRTQQHAALDTACIWHRQDESITLGSSKEPKSYTCVAAGGFYQHGTSRSNQPFGFCLFNHCKSNAIFDALTRLQALQLACNARYTPLGHAVKKYHRCPAN
mmetsp:Transcript_22631/g.67392  ORF Transcript_22631/g.67392 Transcript_22631/m.67392 type:complete len:210 (+) Transcript_22631:571-1200(+)